MSLNKFDFDPGEGWNHDFSYQADEGIRHVFSQITDEIVNITEEDSVADYNQLAFISGFVKKGRTRICDKTGKTIVESPIYTATEHSKLRKFTLDTK